MGGSITLKLLETHPERLLSVTSGGSTGFRASDTTEQWDSAFVKKLVAGEPLSQAMLETAPPDYAKLGGRPVPTLLIVGGAGRSGAVCEAAGGDARCGVRRRAGCAPRQRAGRGAVSRGATIVSATARSAVGRFPRGSFDA